MWVPKQLDPAIWRWPGREGAGGRGENRRQARYKLKLVSRLRTGIQDLPGWLSTAYIKTYG